MSTPPAYHDHHPALAQDVLADDPYSTPSSPQYTLDAPPCERVLQTSSATTSSGSFILGNASSSEFVFKGYAMEINLGPKLWGLMLPAFGHNGNVEGTVKLYKNCTHTLRLVVSLTGRATITCSRGRGIIADAFATVVSQTVTIPLPGDGPYYPTEQPYAFSIPFPTYVKGGTLPIPPSFAAWSPGISSEVSYTLKVDAYRKGLRRHEDRIIPVFYLPKTWPSVPPFHGDIMTDFANPHGRVKTLRIPRLVSSLSSKNKLPDGWKAPIVKMCMPALSTFSSGFPIPLKVDISCPESPALPKMLCPFLEVQLLRRLLVVVDGKMVLGSRDIVVCSGSLIETVTPQEGTTVSHFEVMVGQPGHEQTWQVKDIIDVSYILSVSIKPSENMKYLPRYRHEEVIHVVSEPWGTREREMLHLGGISAPAVALNGARRPLRLTHSMDW